MSNKNTDTKIEELKEEPKTNESKELVIQEDSKIRKIVTIALTGLAAVATGIAGFILGRRSGNDDGDEESAQEEKTEE